MTYEAHITGSALDEAKYACGQVAHYFSALISPPAVKVGGSAALAMLSWIGMPVDLVLPVGVLCVADTLSGMIKARVTRTFSSRQMYRFVWKWMSYALLLISVGALSHFHKALHPATEWVSGMIAMTEFVSTAENLKCAAGSGLIARVLAVVEAFTKKGPAAK
jgi:phage-related holin